MANIKVINKISKEELEELYLRKFMSTREIAKVFNCNATTIGDLLKRYDIPARPVGGGKKVPVVQIEQNGVLVEAKRCTVCNEVKPLEDYNIDRKGSGGRQPKCKECRKSYHLNNREHIKNKSMRHYYKNHEENKLKRRIYNSKHKIQRRKKQRERYYLDHEKSLLANREYYHANKDEILQRERLRRLKNIEDYREKDRKRYIRRREQRSTYHKQYYEINKDQIKLNTKKRKKFIKSLPFTLTEQQWEQIQGDFNYSCVLSEHKDDLNMEHFIPVSWGHGGTYLGNVYPVHWRINRSKSDTNPFVWIERDDVKELVDMEKWIRLVNYLAKQNGLSVSKFYDFINWCESNKRDFSKIKDGEQTSIEIWKNSL